MPRAVLVSYATRDYRANQWRNARTARRVGGLDEVWRLGPADLDPEFRRRNAEVLAAPRGAGYWLWKPYVVVRSLERLAPGDVLFYCDAASHFRSSAQPLIDLCLRQDVVPFELPYLERAWTKRDAFVLLGCDEPAFAETPQRLASFALFRKTSAACDLAARWLEAAQDPRILTDAPNVCGLPNHPGFVDHRHDQSIFSLLTKRAGYPSHRDPSRPPDPADGPAAYARILSHTRRRRVPLRYRLLSALRVRP
jgi:hypothetical protein